jgi:hypothetical protein
MQSENGPINHATGTAATAALRTGLMDFAERLVIASATADQQRRRVGTENSATPASGRQS